MNHLALSVSIYLVFVFGDRLRQINWTTAKPIFVLLYLSHSCASAGRWDVDWAGQLVAAGLTGPRSGHQRHCGCGS